MNYSNITTIIHAHGTLTRIAKARAVNTAYISSDVTSSKREDVWFIGGQYVFHSRDANNCINYLIEKSAARLRDAYHAELDRLAGEVREVMAGMGVEFDKDE